MKIYENLDINDLNGEIWEVIKDFPDYQVSNLGRVKSLKFEKEMILKQSKNSNFYFCVGLSVNRKQKTKQVHNLIYETFNNYKLKPSECIHHRDENKENNYYENLKLMSKLNHNSFHKKGKSHTKETKIKISENHLYQKGEKNNNSILITQDVIQIKLLLKNRKLLHREISDIFNVSRRTITDIKNNRRWSHIKI